MASFLSRYVDALVGARAARRSEESLLQGRNRVGYSFAARYWASLTGAKLPLVVATAAEVRPDHLLADDPDLMEPDLGKRPMVARRQTGPPRPGDLAGSGQSRLERRSYLVPVSVTAAVLTAATTTATVILVDSASDPAVKIGAVGSLTLLVSASLAWIWSEPGLSRSRPWRGVTQLSVRDLLGSPGLATKDRDPDYVRALIEMLVHDEVLRRRVLDQGLGSIQDPARRSSPSDREAATDSDTFVIEPPSDYLDNQSPAATSRRKQVAVLATAILTAAALGAATLRATAEPPPLRKPPPAEKVVCSQPAIDRYHPVQVHLTIDPTGLTRNSRSAQASVRRQVIDAHGLQGRRAALVIVYTGNAESSGNALLVDGFIKKILIGLGNQNLVFHNAVYIEEQLISAPPTTVVLTVFLFEQQRCTTVTVPSARGG